VVNVLAAQPLAPKPRLCSTFLRWLLSELFDNLPEVGDLERPGLVLLLDDAPPAPSRSSPWARH
jgi:DNA helicase HerA-like ATPase